jgi:hypothetical protein
MTMTTTTRRHALSDAQWQAIESLLAVSFLAMLKIAMCLWFLRK